MKPKHTLGLAIATAVTLTSTDSMKAAAYIGTAYEGFDYANNTTIGGTTTTGPNGGTGFNSTGNPALANTTRWIDTPGASHVEGLAKTGSLSVSTTGYPSSTGNKLSVTGVATTGSSYRALGQTVDSGTLYFSFLSRRTNTTNRSVNVAFYNSGSTVERFNVGQTGTNTATGSPSSTYSAGNIALALNNGANVFNSAAPVAYGTNTTHLIIGRVDFNFTGAFERIRLYVDPSSLSSEPGTAYVDNTSIDVTNIVGFRPFAGNSTTGANVSATADFDEFRFGTTFESVAVPEPSSATLLVLGALGCTLRRKR